MSAKGPVFVPYNTPAAALSGANLGALVMFSWFFPTSNTEAKVTGELREVWHSFTDGVVLRILGDTDGGHTADEFTIPRDRHVRVLSEGYAP